MVKKATIEVGRDLGDGKKFFADETCLTFRQVVLLKLLKSGTQIFKKRTLVPEPLSDKEWKYCNSLVDGNCMWFGGNTTRRDSKLRGKIHHKELGFQNKLKLIVHTDMSHRTYKMNANNIKKYLLATLSYKYEMQELPEVIEIIEEKWEIELTNFIGGYKHGKP